MIGNSKNQLSRAQEQTSIGVLILLVLGELILLVAIPLALISFSDELKLNAQSWYSTRLVILCLGALFLLHIAHLTHSRASWLRNLALIIAILLIPFICLTILHPPQKLKGRVGQWLHDNLVGIEVPQRISGNLLGEENYDLPLNIENCTSMPLEITKIEVKTFNDDIKRAFGKNDEDPNFVSTYEVMKYLKANDHDSVIIPGNPILPKAAIISIYHTLSGEPSRFEVDLGSKLLPMPQPRQLPNDSVYAGADALNFITRAAESAHQWGDQVCLMAAFPGDSTTYIDFSSRLKYIAISNWWVTFFSYTRNELYAAEVTRDSVEGHEVPREDPTPDLPPQPIELPLIGNQKALDIANVHNLLSGDWKDGPRLEAINVDGSWRLGWFLPYRGTDALPIIIDAGTGDPIKVHGSSFIPDGSTTSLAPDQNAQNQGAPNPNANSEPPASPSAADEPPVIVTWLSSDEDTGMNSSYPLYDCRPLDIATLPMDQRFNSIS